MPLNVDDKAESWKMKVGSKDEKLDTSCFLVSNFWLYDLTYVITLGHCSPADNAYNSGGEEVESYLRPTLSHLIWIWRKK